MQNSGHLSRKNRVQFEKLCFKERLLVVLLGKKDFKLVFCSVVLVCWLLSIFGTAIVYRILWFLLRHCTEKLLPVLAPFKKIHFFQTGHESICITASYGETKLKSNTFESLFYVCYGKYRFFGFCCFKTSKFQNCGTYILLGFYTDWLF